MRWISAPLGALYINRQVLSVFLTTLVILLSIALGDKLIQLLEKAATGNVPSNQVMYIVSLRIPELAQLVMPLALYIGLVIGLGRLYSRQEMSVLKSGGLSTLLLLKWLAPTISLTTALVAFVSLVLTPMARHTFAQELFELQKSVGIAALQPGVFRIEDTGDQVTYSNAIGDDKRTILDVFIRQQLADGRQITVWAESGQRSDPDAEGRQILTLENGRRYVGRAGNPAFETMTFAELKISVETDPVLEQARDLQSLPLSELDDSLEHRAEWHWRLGWPIFSVILALLAVAISSVKPRQGQYARIGVAVLWMVSYCLLLVLNRWLIAQGLVPSILGLWPVHLAFGLAATRNLYLLGRPAVS